MKDIDYKINNDNTSSFINKSPLEKHFLPKLCSTSLSQYYFSVKDVIDVAGIPTSGGNPDWLKTHSIPLKSAPLIQELLSYGAKYKGKNHTDELGASLYGKNFHYGTPINPIAPTRIPGGSSSGSAIAVAKGLVDFSVGADTGGSIRAPASMCGIVGYRPTHQLFSCDGAIPISEELDTLVFFQSIPVFLKRWFLN